MSEREETVNYYDAEADVYDQVRYGSKKGIRVDGFHKKVLTDNFLAKLPHNAKLIEIGCGTGRLTSHVLSSGRNVVGLDVSSGMLRVARDRLRASNASLLAGSLDNLPFLESEFDGAYAILVLNLMPDLPSAFTELARVIKPGGTLFFNLPNLKSIYFPAGMYVNFRQKTVTRNHVGYRYSHWYTLGSVTSLLQSAGFQLVDVTPQPCYLADENGTGIPGPLSSRLMSKSLYYTAHRIT